MRIPKVHPRLVGLRRSHRHPPRLVAPVIRLLLVIQVPHASDKKSVALLSCPIDGFQGGEDVVYVVFCGNRHMRGDV